MRVSALFVAVQGATVSALHALGPVGPASWFNPLAWQ